ncbi:hypothetical protein TNCV_3939971 [Trichonephila clavipes]|uniref:Uncharacterized protein n=1 Tax=Trichonephila clavipes TaxID=2585209 RepID=A0A8X6VVR2_TRICX|nr:hypothetical protein TNCV_3939971 [Trichonephila clavipes]
MYSPKNQEFQTICQLATWDDRRPSIDLGLPPYTIITHSIKRRQSIEPILTPLQGGSSAVRTQEMPAMSPLPRPLGCDIT